MAGDPQNKPWWHDSLMSFFSISAWIVGPIVLGIFLGGYLDSLFSTGSRIRITLTALFFIVSVYHMVKDGQRYEDKIEHQDHPEKFINQTEEKNYDTNKQ